jgi:hypothetical protein
MDAACALSIITSARSKRLQPRVLCLRVPAPTSLSACPTGLSACPTGLSAYKILKPACMQRVLHEGVSNTRGCMYIFAFFLKKKKETVSNTRDQRRSRVRLCVCV